MSERLQCIRRAGRPGSLADCSVFADPVKSSTIARLTKNAVLDVHPKYSPGTCSKARLGKDIFTRNVLSDSMGSRGETEIMK